MPVALKAPFEPMQTPEPGCSSNRAFQKPQIMLCSVQGTRRPCNKINITDYKQIFGSKIWRVAIKTNTTEKFPVYISTRMLVSWKYNKNSKSELSTNYIPGTKLTTSLYFVFNLQNSQEHRWGNTPRDVKQFYQPQGADMICLPRLSQPKAHVFNH